MTQSALTQDALKKSEGVVGNAYQELRTGVATAPAVYTDDTGWRIHGQAAYWMTFDTDLATVFQIRSRHRNEEVRELVPTDYAGVMVPDRGPSEINKRDILPVGLDPEGPGPKYRRSDRNYSRGSSVNRDRHVDAAAIAGQACQDHARLSR